MGRYNVVVIGAGAAGLCAAKHLSSSDKFNFQVFEKTGSIGGVWAYTDEVNFDKYGLPVHSSMYKNLRTNLPGEIMSFLHYPIQPLKESYIHHSEFLKYLQSYADHYDLKKYIKFQKEVVRVSPVSIGNENKWNVAVNDVISKNEETYIFDAVMVCNGHFSAPNIPYIPNIENFKGLKIHSHDYRKPEVFTGKNVVIWGGSFSGFDISQEIALVANSVVLCHRMEKEKIPQGLPENVKLSANITSAFEDGFNLQDGSICKADTLIYCTGYFYSFPFLSKDCKIEVIDNCVMPLYKHLVNIEYPTMCFVGLLNFIIPFIEFDYQVQFFLKTLDKSITLPSKEEMIHENDQEKERRRKNNIPDKYTHYLDTLQWDYYKYFANLLELEELPPVIRNIMENSIAELKTNISGFRNYNYTVIDSEHYQKSEAPKDM